MSARPVPPTLLDGWFAPLRRHRWVRRDAARFLRSVDRRDLLAAAEALTGFHSPALVVWAAEDRVILPAYARRLANLLPDTDVVMLPDSRTLVPLDQPA